VTDASAVDVNIIVPAIQWRPLERSAREQRHYHGQDSKAQRNPAAAQPWQRGQHAPVRTTEVTGPPPKNYDFKNSRNRRLPFTAWLCMIQSPSVDESPS
jgi:hypothetical protein